MYVMALLLLGSLFVGLSGRLGPTRQTRFALAAAVFATAVYFLFEGAM